MYIIMDYTDKKRMLLTKNGCRTICGRTQSKNVPYILQEIIFYFVFCSIYPTLSRRNINEANTISGTNSFQKHEVAFKEKYIV